jgi:hypothetical protein
VPAEQLLNAAKDSDMLVIGSRGAGGFKDLLLGSVSTHITHHAHCPVIVIHSLGHSREQSRITALTAADLMTKPPVTSDPTSWSHARPA